MLFTLEDFFVLSDSAEGAVVGLPVTTWIIIGLKKNARFLCKHCAKCAPFHFCNNMQNLRNKNLCTTIPE